MNSGVPPTLPGAVVISEWLGALELAGTAWIQVGLYLFLMCIAVGWLLDWRRGRCQREMAILVALPGGPLSPGERAKLDHHEVVIGRAPGVQIRVPAPAISLSHAAIRVEGDNHFLRALAPGIRLNGHGVEQRATLHDGDLLDVAGQPFRFEALRADARDGTQPLLLPLALTLFAGVQLAAWIAAGPQRPDLQSFALWVAGLAAFSAVAQQIVRARRGRTDPLLVPCALVLLGLGLAVLLRTRPELYERQAVAAAAGLGAMLVAAVAPLKNLAQYRFLSAAGALLLLVLTAVLGHQVGDQRLAISLGGLRFQPAEPAKLLIAVFLAGLLSERQGVVSRAARGWVLTGADARYLGPVAVAWVVALALLILQRDLGTALLFFGLFVAFLSLASGRGVFLLVGLGAFAGGGLLSIAAFDRVRERIDLWLDPWQDPQGVGYQLCQALFALGAGGERGLGFGHGFPGFIPAAHTDLPLAVLGEELGFLGCNAILALYLVVALRGYRTARRSEDEFSGLLAAGLTMAFVLQTLVIVGGVVRALPLTGVTLPFISFGGTSLVVNLVLVGALLNVSGGSLPSHQARERAASPHAWQRHLRWAVAASVLGLATVAGFLAYWQLVRPLFLSTHPANSRWLALERRLERGRIVAMRGEVLAETIEKNEKRDRRYPQGSLMAGVLGYSSLRHGRTGVESVANLPLLGLYPGVELSEGIKRARSGLPGHNVRLTLSLPLQHAAAAALGGKRGSIVAIDPRTGAIRAMVSHPRASYAQVDERWDQLVKDRKKPLLFRAARGLYPPGSTFKTVTAAAALEAGIVRPESRFYCSGGGGVGGYYWQCFGGTAHGHLTFADALRVSCNTTFGYLGRKLGRDRLVAQARRFGLADLDELDIEVVNAVIDPQRIKWRSIPVQLGFGQGPLAVAPIHMAMVASGIANDGVVMRPHAILTHETPDKKVLWRAAPVPLKRAMSARTSRQLRAAMVRAVEAGTGGAARLPGISVAGKTGTAENPHGQDHAWFICMAPANRPTIALAVLVEGGGQGGKVAAPMARQVLSAHFDLKSRH